MGEDNNILISPKKGIDVVVNTPIDKGLEEPGLSTTRLDMSSPFIAINKTEKNSIDFEQQSEVMIAKETWSDRVDPNIRRGSLQPDCCQQLEAENSSTVEL